MKERHDETDADYQVALSSEGRKFMKEKSFPNANINQAIAFGSPRIRTQEAAAISMTGSQDEITGDETFDVLKNKIDRDLKIGSKIGIDARLNIHDDPKSPLGKAIYEAFYRGESTKFLIEESDKFAKETGDTTHSNYSYKAGRVAQIIEKYLKIAPSWNKLVENKDKKYNDTLERYLSTHQGICESFLAKVIEKTEGIEEKNKFITSIGSQGFDYAEGFDIEIKINNTDDPIIEVKFKKDLKDGSGYSFKNKISRSLIEEIIKEGIK